MTDTAQGTQNNALSGHGACRAPDSFSEPSPTRPTPRLQHLLSACIVFTLFFLAARLCLMATNRTCAYAFLCALLLHWLSKPPGKDLAWAGGLGLLALATYRLAGGQFYPTIDFKIFDLTAFAGIGSLTVLAWRYFSALDCDAGSRAARLFRSAAAMPVCCLATFTFFAVCFSTGATETSWDRLLYRFDLRLGAPWSFLVGQMFEQNHWLRDFCRLVYGAVLFGLALFYVALREKTTALPINTVAAFLVGALTGALCYFVTPGAGPVYIFPGWPNHPPAEVLLAPLAVTGVRLNALPSLHTFLALLVLWNSRAGGRGLRAFGILFFLFTELATLGLGEHYLVDLITTVPFAVAVEAVCARGIGWKEPRRYQAFLVNTLLFGGWLVLLRSLAWTSWPVWLLWMVVAISVVVPFLMERRLTGYHSARRTSPFIADSVPLTAAGRVTA